jgi:hypothetical protein
MTLAASCVQDGMTGDVILKLVNAVSEPKPVRIDLLDSRISYTKPNKSCSPVMSLSVIRIKKRENELVKTTCHPSRWSQGP